MTHRDALTDRIVSDFLLEVAEDRMAGRELPLGHYLAKRPGHEAEIAGEYLALHGRVEAREPAEPALPGDSLGAQHFVGPYRIVRELGRGGQATVFLAEDRRIARRVALKVFHTGAGRLDPAGLRRFRREAELLARLDHPSLCTVHDAEVDGETPYIAMRYVEGESLAARIARRREGGTGPPERDGVMELVRVLEQCARALHAAHEAGLLHRDIKPGNVMLTASGAPVLLDFGLAHDQEAAGPALTRTGDVLGTPAYLAPETLSRASVDRRADVYALGVTLYECLTLRHPFEAPTRDGLYQEILRGAPPDVRRLNRHVDADLAVVLAVALEREPDRRYRTALDFALDLERVARGAPVAARPPSLARRLRHTLRAHPVRSSLLAAALSFLIVGWSVTAHLLGLARAERNAKVAALAKLDGFLSPADTAERLRRLAREGEALVINAETVGHANVRAWLDESRALLEHLPDHRAALATLRAKARPAASASEDAPPEFDSALDAWSYHGVTLLVEELEEFAALRARFEQQHERARAARAESLDAGMSAWNDVCAELAAPPAGSPYAPLALGAQPGLLPLGKDPRSGLFEFAHLQSGAAPTRDPATGALHLGEASAVVLVLLPGGAFEMGALDAAPDERPAHRVDLAPFLIAKHELTQAQWLRLAGSNPSNYRMGARIAGVQITGLHPVEWVTWEECTAELARHGLALPTEAQWEYAARAGTRTPWWTGAEPESLRGAANLRDRTGHAFTETDERAHDAWLDDGHAVHAPVGTYLANPFGLHDLLGNVLEWCRDAYGSYDIEPRAGDGLRHEHGDEHVLRGGSFYHHAAAATASHRSHTGLFWGLNIGARPVWELR